MTPVCPAPHRTPPRTLLCRTVRGFPPAQSLCAYVLISGADGAVEAAGHFPIYLGAAAPPQARHPPTAEQPAQARKVRKIWPGSSGGSPECQTRPVFWHLENSIE